MKVLALAFPILLFIFKYILPSIAEAVYKKTEREKEQVKIELIHFPVDLLFIAISYTIPKIIELTSRLSLLVKLQPMDIDTYKELLSKCFINFSLSMFILLLIPFCVFVTKLVEKYYYSESNKWYKILFLVYFVAISLVCLSIFYN